jgi:hypothetical protein
MEYKRRVGSPKLSAGESETSSAIDRIRSDKNMRNALLPQFMRSSASSKKSVAFYSSNDRGKSPVLSANDRSKSPSRDFYEQFLQFIFNPSKDPSEILIRVRQRDIYREDLRTFTSGECLTRSVIDACLSIIKQLNHDFLIKDEANDKVIISSTEFSQNIFCTAKLSNFHAPTYVMKYE